MKLRDMQAPRQGHQSRGSSWEVPSSRSYGTADAARRDVREGMFSLCFVRLVWAHTLSLKQEGQLSSQTDMHVWFEMLHTISMQFYCGQHADAHWSCPLCWLFDSTSASSPRRVLASSHIFLIKYVFSSSVMVLDLFMSHFSVYVVPFVHRSLSACSMQPRCMIVLMLWCLHYFRSRL